MIRKVALFCLHTVLSRKLSYSYLCTDYSDVTFLFNFGLAYEKKQKVLVLPVKKTAEKVKKSEIIAIFDHKNNEMLKCCNVTSLCNHLAFQNNAQYLRAIYSVDLSRHLGKLFTE